MTRNVFDSAYGTPLATIEPATKSSLSLGRWRCRALMLPASLLGGVGYAILIAAAAGCRPDSEPRAEAEPTTQATSTQPILVRLGEFQRGDVEDRLPVAADLEARFEADVYPEISGVVADVSKREGDAVRAGDLIVQMIDAELKLSVENERILARQAEISVDQATVARQEGAKIREQRQLLVAKARAEYERFQKLAAANSGVVSEEELDAKKYDLDQALIDEQTAALQGEKYSLEHAQAVENERLQRVALRKAEYRLSQTFLRSPIDGVVSYLRVKPGELVSSSTKVFSVVEPSRLQARLYVPQRELGRIRSRLPVVLRSEVFPEREFRSTIEFVNPVVDKDRGTIEVLVFIEDTSDFLKPGMFVSGEIVLETRSGVVLVPKKAISYRGQEPTVFLVREGRAWLYRLQEGIPRRDVVEVVALFDSDGVKRETSAGRLVLVGHDRLEDGAAVEIEP